MKPYPLFLLLTFAASMLGGLIPAVEGFIERLGPELVLSFRSGLLISVAASDVLPEAWRSAPLPALIAAASALALGWRLHHSHAGEHAGHELTHPHIHAADRAHRLTALGALFAHALVDGLNLGAVALIGGPSLFAIGAATSLHKLADGFTVTSLFHNAGHARSRVLGWLTVISLATPLGAVMGRSGVGMLGPTLAAVLLGFAGGSFFFVGATQILPRWRSRRPAGSALAFAAGASLIVLLKIAS